MTNLLARTNREVLEQLAWSRALLAFDFDGTLAPIVESRSEAAMRSSTARLFGELCALYPCAVISGRARADVARRLAGARVQHIIGNHGLEPGAGLGELERQVARCHPRLKLALASVRGVEVEGKQYSLAVHYRRARRKRAARDAIVAAVAALPVRMRVVPGKLVLNVVPRGAPNKGEALTRLRDRTGADVALYVGDDVTDEDVFRLDQPGRLLSVRVGRARASAAEFYVRGQREVDALLRRLVAARTSRVFRRVP